MTCARLWMTVMRSTKSLTHWARRIRCVFIHQITNKSTRLVLMSLRALSTAFFRLQSVLFVRPLGVLALGTNVAETFLRLHNLMIACETQVILHRGTYTLRLC